MIGRREGLLLGGGVIILALVIWRQQQLEQWDRNPRQIETSSRQLAPRFELADQNRKVHKLEGLLGRHRIVLVFFDANLGVDRDPRIRPLIDNFEVLDRAGFKILGVGTATPFANEEAEKRLGREVPFPVLTDINVKDPVPMPAHHRWGLIDPVTQQPRPALFLIERDGTVEFDIDGEPVPVDNERESLDILIEGRWPEERP